MAHQHLTSRREGPIEYLTLNRPEVRNAFNDGMIAELTAWADAVARDTSIRVAVIAGAGPAFCAGADLGWMAASIAYGRDENVRDAAAAARMYSALDTLPFPLVARLHGVALGGGAGLAAVCDVAVAEEETVFAFSEVKLGILPAVIAPFVVAKIGVSAARELFLTGRRFPAARARDIGLVHAVVPAAGLDEAIAEYVREILAAGPEAVAHAKALISQVTGRPAGEVAALTAEAIASRRVAPEGQEGLRAFLEKRSPSWRR